MKKIKTLIKELSSLEKLIILVVAGLITTVTYNTYTNRNVSADFFRSVLGESSENSSEFSYEGSYDEGSSEDFEESSVSELSELSELSEDSELSEFSEESSENSIWLFRLFEQGLSPVEESEISEESIDEVSQEESSEFSELSVAEDMIDELESATKYRTIVTKRFLFLIPVNVERVIETDAEGNVVSEKQTFFYRILDILSF